ncbi:MAG: PQQ-binding-like beta-propeller repeat protein [Planctomycetota bacterium]
MARTREMLFAATHRWVAAIDPKTGEELWRTKLPQGGFSVPIILIKDTYLYVGHAGHVYCLDKRYGEVIWDNGLPKMGFQTVVLAMEGATTSDVAAAAAGTTSDRRRRAAAAAGGGAAAGS